MDRLFLVDAPSLGEAMPAVSVYDAILCHVPQPEVERHIRLLEIVTQSLIRFDENVLHDVRRIDPAGERGIKSEVHDLPERLAKLGKERIDRLRRLRFRVGKKPISAVGCGPHIITS